MCEQPPRIAELPLRDLLAWIEAHVDDPAAEVGHLLAGLVPRLEALGDAREAGESVDAVVASARRLYAQARSAEALPALRAALELALRLGDRARIRNASTACGLLASDVGDIVGAIELHLRALRLAAADDDRLEMSRIWNNIGVAATFSGNHDMAVKCYRRALALTEAAREPVFSRFAALANAANSLYHLGEIREGLEMAERALAALTDEFRRKDPLGELLLRRNLVRLLVAHHREAQAVPHVRAAVEAAERIRSPRALIIAETTRATLEIATGRVDVALTRLDKALAYARQVPATLPDTLAALIHAEEAAGQAGRALLRLEELSRHVYRSGIEQARRQVGLAGLTNLEGGADEHLRAQARARLIAQLSPPGQPEGWKALQRLGVSASMRTDATGWHGIRVGALTKALAGAVGMPPLQCVEVGLAAELHDIGMISVPESILTKKEPLTEAERTIVRRHSDAGAQMLADASHPRLLMARDIAKYHHGFWDGKGHPERVGGERIPVAARMCAIADAYDAMVCGGYGSRPPRTMGQALEELRRCAGAEFDPGLVATFVDMIHDESRGLGLDLASGAGMGDFQELVVTLKEDKGFA